MGRGSFQPDLIKLKLKVRDKADKGSLIIRGGPGPGLTHGEGSRRYQTPPTITPSDAKFSSRCQV